MKKIALVLLLCAPIIAGAKMYNWTVTRIIDGDTVGVAAPWVPDPLKKEVSIRVWGVDTPEKAPRAQCPAEAAKAKAASQYTQAQLSAATRIQVEVRDWDKYGGRMLGDIYIDGKSLRTLLLSAGHAREYYGGTKTSWCN